MSIAVKCDRCGKFFNPNIQMHKVGGWNQRMYIRLYSHESRKDGLSLVVRDLCENCMFSLEEWLASGVKENERQE